MVDWKGTLCKCSQASEDLLEVPEVDAPLPAVSGMLAGSLGSNSQQVSQDTLLDWFCHVTICHNKHIKVWAEVWSSPWCPTRNSYAYYSPEVDVAQFVGF